MHLQRAGNDQGVFRYLIAFAVDEVGNIPLFYKQQLADIMAVGLRVRKVR